MILDELIVISVAISLIFYLIRRFIVRYAPENILLVPVTVISLIIYIILKIKAVNVPTFMQIIIYFTLFLIPLTFSILQLNNIILSRKYLYFKMKLAYKNENYDDTIKLLQRLIYIEGRKSIYYYYLGMCYKFKKEYTNSKDSFALAIEYDKRDYRAYYELGVLLDSVNKKETAIIMLNNSLRIKPDFYEAFEALGICLTSQAKYEDAVKVYEIAISYHPNSCELYYNVAMIEIELGNYDLAEEYFKKAVKIKPKLYSAYYNIGKINYFKGDLNKAIEFFKLARSSTLYGAKAYYKLANVYSAKNELEKAMSCLEYAMEIEPSFIKEAQTDFMFTDLKERIEDYINMKKEREKKEKKIDQNDYYEVTEYKYRKRQEISKKIEQDIEREKSIEHA